MSGPLINGPNVVRLLSEKATGVMVMVDTVLNSTEKGKIRSKIANILNLIAWTHRRTASKEQCSEYTKKNSCSIWGCAKWYNT